MFPSAQSQSQSQSSVASTAMNAASAFSISRKRSFSRSPNVMARIVTTVQESIEELWKCQEPEHAASWLQLMYQSLLRERLDMYDPSETFLCIQGAALRFSIDHQDARVWEEAIWAAAALARVCIGPSWHHQNHQRRNYLTNHTAAIHNPTNYHFGSATGSTAGPEAGENSMSLANHLIGANHSLEGDGPGITTNNPLEVLISNTTENSSSPRSFSPMTSASTADVATTTSSNIASLYPSIPEVLPGALLRFGAMCKIEQRSIAEAQRELVTALCSDTIQTPDDESYDRLELEWMIPGAHEPVGAMMKSWFRLASVPTNDKPDATRDSSTPMNGQGSASPSTNKLGSRPLDWWYTLQVSRACTDLASAGWSPLLDDEIILYLLSVAENGTFLRLMRFLPNETSQHAHEEPLAAISSAAEALSALNTLGSRGFIPECCQQEVVRVMVRILASAKPLVFPFRGAKPSLSETQVDGQPTNVAFSTHKESCLEDAADLLWVMLAHQTSATLSVSTLRDILDDPDRRTLLVLVQTVRRALWGSPPRVPAIPKLHLYWNAFLVLFKRHASENFTKLQPGDSTQEKWEGIEESLTIALEIAVACSRFVDVGLMQRGGLFPTDEWDSFIGLLEESVLPWLAFDTAHLLATGDDGTISSIEVLIDKVVKEAQSVLLVIGEFLEISSRQSKCPFHVVIGNESRERLYLTLLRNAAPVMEKGSQLALSVIRSWASVGFLPHCRDAWVENASKIFAEAFAVYQEEGNLSRYVHSSYVRLEALVLLTDDDGYIHRGRRFSLSDEHSETSNTVILSLSSPLTATQNLREQHLELITNALLPPLSMIFEMSPSNFSLHTQPQVLSPPLEKEHTLKQHSTTTQSDSSGAELTDEEFELRKFATNLIGRLFRSVTGDRKHRCFFVDLLKAIALESDDLPPQTNLANKDAEVSSNPVLSKQLSLCLTAIFELELCMCVPFTTFPHTHECLPSMLDAISSILDHYKRTQVELSPASEAVLLPFRLLSFAALLPLARLRTSGHGNIGLASRREAMAHVPDFLDAIFGTPGEKDQTNRQQTALFVTVESKATKPTNQPKTPVERTSVSFGEMLFKLLAFLQFSTETDRIDSELDSRFRATCYDVLSSSGFSGTLFPFAQILEKLISFPRPTGPYAETECESRMQATRSFLQQCLAKAALPNSEVRRSMFRSDDAKARDLVSSCITMMVDVCKSTSPREALAGIRSLYGLLPSLEANKSFIDWKSAFESIVIGIKERILLECDFERDKQDPKRSPNVASALMSFLYSTLSANDVELLSKDSRSELLNLYHISSGFGLVNDSPGFRICALKCLALTLDAMTDNEMDEYMATAASNPATTQAAGQQEHFVESNLFSSLVLRRRLWRHYAPHQTSLEEAMAMQVVNSKRYQSGKSDSWLCGDTLLTLRVGAPETRYRGWIEVSLRGPTFWHRHLVPVGGTLLIAEPERYLARWDVSGGMRDSSETPEAYMTVNLGGHESGHAMSTAKAIIERFDRLHSGSDSNAPRPNVTIVENGTIPGDTLSSSSKTTQNSSDHSCEDNYQKWLQDNAPGGTQAVVNHLCDLGFDNLESLKRIKHPKLDRAVSILDRLPVVDTAKIALFFAHDARLASNHNDAVGDYLLGATGVSPLFRSFADGLGKLTMTRTLKVFSAGLDTSGFDADGKFTLSWVQDDRRAPMHLVVFHAVAFMPQGMNVRKRHVGNDNVFVIYLDPGSPLIEMVRSSRCVLASPMISGDFGFVVIFVQDQGGNACRVSVRLRPGLSEQAIRGLSHLVGDDIVPTGIAPIFVRRVSILSDLACRSLFVDLLGSPTNWEERRQRLGEMNRYVSQQSN